MRRAAVFLVLAALGVALLLRFGTGFRPDPTAPAGAPAWTGTRAEPPDPPPSEDPGTAVQDPGPLVEIPSIPGVAIRADGPFALVLFREDTDIPAVRIEGKGAEPDETGEMFLVREARLTLFGPDGSTTRASVDASVARVPAQAKADSVVILEDAAGRLAEDSSAGPLRVIAEKASASVDSFRSDGEVTIETPGAVCRGSGVSWSADEGLLVVESQILIEAADGAVITSNGPLSAAIDTSGEWRIETAGGVTIEPGPDLPARLAAASASFTVRPSDQGPVLEHGSLAGPVTFEADGLSGMATGASLSDGRLIVLHQPIRISLTTMAPGGEDAQLTSTTPMQLGRLRDSEEVVATIDGSVFVQDPAGAVLQASSFRTSLSLGGPEGARSALFGGPVRGHLPRGSDSLITFQADGDLVAGTGTSDVSLRGNVQVIVRGGPRDGQILAADAVGLGARGDLVARGQVRLEDPLSGVVLTGERLDRDEGGRTVLTGAPARLVEGGRSIRGARIEMAAGGASALVSGNPIVLSTEQGPVLARNMVWSRDEGTAVLTGGVEARSEVMGWFAACRRLVVDQGSGLPLEADGVVVRVDGAP